MSEQARYLRPLYGTWTSMNGRCHSPTNTQFKHYGARGIAVCPAWRESFDEFEAYVTQLAHCGEKGYTLDRVDNNGHYEPGNVRWATNLEQHRNMRSSRMLSWGGKTQCLKDWADEIGITVPSLQGRLARGWSTEEALSTPMYGLGRGSPKGKGPELRTEPNRYRMIEYGGRTQSLTAWAKEVGLKKGTLFYRLEHGWDIGLALTTPVQENGERPHDG